MSSRICIGGGGGVASLRAFLAASLRPEQLSRPTVKRLLVGDDADALDAVEVRLAAALLTELRAGDPSVPSARSFLRGCSARVVATPTAAVGAGTDAEEAAGRKRASYLEKRRKKLLRLDEEMRYGSMIRNVKTRTAPRELERHQKSVRQHLSIGVNMVVARVTAFVAVYMLARSLTEDETTRMVAGLGGAIAMMVVEMVLYITRASKLEAVERDQRKRREGVFE